MPFVFKGIKCEGMIFIERPGRTFGTVVGSATAAPKFKK